MRSLYQYIGEDYNDLCKCGSINKDYPVFYSAEGKVAISTDTDTFDVFYNDISFGKVLIGCFKTEKEAKDYANKMNTSELVVHLGVNYCEKIEGSHNDIYKPKYNIGDKIYFFNNDNVEMNVGIITGITLEIDNAIYNINFSDDKIEEERLGFSKEGLAEKMIEKVRGMIS